MFLEVSEIHAHRQDLYASGCVQLCLVPHMFSDRLKGLLTIYSNQIVHRLNPASILREIKKKKTIGVAVLAGWAMNEMLVDPMTCYLLAKWIGHANYFPILIPFVHTELISTPILTKLTCSVKPRLTRVT